MFQGPIFKITNAPWGKGKIYVDGYPSGEISSSFIWEEPSVEDEPDIEDFLANFFGWSTQSAEKQNTKSQMESRSYEPGRDEVARLADMLADDIYVETPPREEDIPYREFPREEGRNRHQDINRDQNLMEVRAYPGEEELGTFELPWASFPVNSYHEIETVKEAIEDYPPPNLR